MTSVRDVLDELDRHDEALPVIQEAVETWRRVVAGEPYDARRLELKGVALREKFSDQ